MSAAITKAIVVRAKRPGGFWSAGRFFAADSATEVEVTERELEQLVTDRQNGFLELRGLSFDDILEVGAVPRSDYDALVRELERVREQLTHAHAQVEALAAERDAAIAAAESAKVSPAEPVAPVEVEQPEPDAQPNAQPSKPKKR